MKILVTGAMGQLGRDVTELCRSGGHTVFALDRQEMDITDWEQVKAAFEALRPDAVIHTAAYTAVDRAEAEPDEAYRVNTVGTRNIAAASERVGARCCYISTDYVFDGKSSQPCGEYDRTDPQSVYGKTKLAGERLVSALCTRWYIVRTSWVYGRHGSNFVKTMLRLAAEGKPIRVVADQTGSPTYTRDLAGFLAELVGTEAYGIYHASGGGSCSWYEFAQAIFDETGLEADLKPCTTAEFPRPAPRPAYSALDSAAIRTNGFRELPHWREALRSFIRGNPGLGEE